MVLGLIGKFDSGGVTKGTVIFFEAIEGNFSLTISKSANEERGLVHTDSRINCLHRYHIRQE